PYFFPLPRAVLLAWPSASSAVLSWALGPEAVLARLAAFVLPAAAGCCGAGTTGGPAGWSAGGAAGEAGARGEGNGVSGAAAAGEAAAACRGRWPMENGRPSGSAYRARRTPCSSLGG